MRTDYDNPNVINRCKAWVILNFWWDLGQPANRTRGGASFSVTQPRLKFFKRGKNGKKVIKSIFYTNMVTTIIQCSPLMSTVPSSSRISQITLYNFQNSSPLHKRRMWPLGSSPSPFLAHAIWPALKKGFFVASIPSHVALLPFLYAPDQPLPDL